MSALGPAAALAALLCGPAWAFRPFTTEDAGVAAVGRPELELGWDAAFQRDRSKEHLQQTTLTLGVLPGVELSADVPLHARGPEARGDWSGLGDVAAGAKWVPLPEAGRRPALAVFGKLKTDSGDLSRGLGNGERDWTVGSALSKTWGGSSMHLNAGRRILGSDETPARRDVWLWGAGGDWAFSKRASLLAEAFGHGSEGPGLEDHVAFRAGTILSFGPDFLLDLSGIHGLTRSTPRWAWTAGLTRVFQ